MAEGEHEWVHSTLKNFSISACEGALKLLFLRLMVSCVVLVRTAKIISGLWEF